MQLPATDIAQKFSTHFRALSDSLKDSETILSQMGKQDKISKAVNLYFDFINQLPETIRPLDYKITILFEIDCALLGIYGNNTFVIDEDPGPVRKLLKDLTALWQRYYLVGVLERDETVGSTLHMTMNYFQEWIKHGKDGKQQAEYDCLLEDVALLLRSSDNLEFSVKIVLFSLIGKILITLGVTEEFAQDRIKQKLGAGRNSVEDQKDSTLAEILLCLQVLSRPGRSLDAIGVNISLLQRSIRYWSSKDKFLEELFKAWGWYTEYDFFTELLEGDKLTLRERSTLCLSHYTHTAKLGIGHSFKELMEFRSQNQNPTAIFQPIPIFIFGHSGVGKSSYLTAFCYHEITRPNGSFVLGQDLRRFYDTNFVPWNSNNILPTVELSSYNLGEDLNLVGYTVCDYNGRETEPDKWDQDMQDRFYKARGLLFFLDDGDYGDPIELRKKAGWFAAVLASWAVKNPQIRHLPIGLVLTKCDIPFGASIRQLHRSTLIDPDFQAPLVEMLLQRRFPQNSSDLGTPYDRFRTMIFNDKTNNLIPALQDLTESLLENFSVFFKQVFGITYNYQIFLTSAHPPENIQDTIFPWGVKEPLAWITKRVEKFHLRESILKFNEEEQKLEGELKTLREDITQLHSYRDQITQINAEIARLNVKWYQNTAEKAKLLQENKQKLEQDFSSILQRYVKESTNQNKAALIQAVEREFDGKKDQLNKIREMRNEYNIRVKG
jgi:GTPase SAR1 family protein